MIFFNEKNDFWLKNFQTDTPYSMFGSTFIELIIDRVDFVKIDLVRIDFEIKWFIYLIVHLKVIMTEDKKFSLLPESILEARIDFDF